MKKTYSTFLILLITFSLVAQNQPNIKKTTFRDSLNNLYWNKDLPVYISLSTNPNGSDGEVLESKQSADYAEPFFFDTEGKNFMRTRWAVDKKTGKLAYPKQEVLWEVYVDGLPPKTKNKFECINKTYKNNEYTYGIGLKVYLTSFDGTSKTKDIYYSVNNEEYKIYAGDLIFNQEGKQNLKFFSVDNVGNVEKANENNFTVDLSAPNSGCTITGVNLGKDNVISLTTKIYIDSKDNLSGVKQIYYSIDSLPEKNYVAGSDIPLSLLKDGNHVLKFYAVDKVNNKEEVQTFEFFLDRTAPITVSDILGDKFVVGDKVYFSGRTKMKITSIDNKAGVKQVLYSVDGSKFDEYNDPFYMPNKAGWHVVKYYAIDSTENISLDEFSNNYHQYKLKIDKIYVDLSGPTLNHVISGDKYARNDTVYIGPNSKINLYATDAESGLQYISYSIDGELDETKYSSPFNLQALSTGKHMIEYFGYDNVNNRNINKFDVILDNSGPDVGHKFSIKPTSSKNGLDVYPVGTALFITVQDDLTGITKIYYSKNGGQKLFYKNYIKDFRKGENNIEIEAFDKLNNRTTYNVKFIIK